MGIFDNPRVTLGPSEELIERIDMLKVRTLPDCDCDEFGFSKEYLKSMAGVMNFFYKYWFRVDLHGIENIPAEGPAIIVPNHSGQLPMDGAMISAGCIMRMDQPRMPRAMIEKWFPTLPVVSKMMQRAGQVVGLTENAERLLDEGELLMVFPEGALGSGKTWDKRYQLQRFTVGFMELAIKYGAPVIPVAVIGGEEQAPAFYNIEPLAKKLGMLYFPITPTFPWLGLFGFIPLPSRYHIYIGEPMDFSDRKPLLDDPDAVRGLAEQVRAEIQQMVNNGLQERVFPGF